MSKLVIPGKIKKGDVVKYAPKRVEKNMGDAEVVEPPKLKDKTLRADPADRRDFEGGPSDIPVDKLSKAGVGAALLTYSSDLNRGEKAQLAAHRAMDEMDKRDKRGIHAEAPKVNREGKGDNEDPRASKKDKEQGPTPKTDRERGKPQLDENGKPKSKIRIEFEKAFVQARKDGKKEFEFMGKKYHTRRADGK